MYRKLGAWFLIGLFAIGSFGFPPGDGVTKRIRFAKGKSSATVSGAVIRGDRDTYILGARAGQSMSVRITSVENNAVFQIEDPHGEYVDGVGDGDDAKSATIVLDDSGDYRIIVGGTRGNATYRLTVSIR
jgi:hypothetical protein